MAKNKTNKKALEVKKGSGAGKAADPVRTWKSVEGRPATAPYNFIPFDRTLPVPGPDDSKTRFSGRIICRLEAKTPLFIGGYSKKGSDAEKGLTERHFLKLNGRYCIPGSSIKGMLRELVEIMSCSQIMDSQISDKRPAYRRVAEADSDYRNKFKPIEKGARDIPNGGYLHKGRDGKYYICPCKVLASRGRHPGALSGEKFDSVSGDGSPRKCVYYFQAPEKDKRLPVSDQVFQEFLEQMPAATSSGAEAPETGKQAHDPGQVPKWKAEQEELPEGKKGVKVFFTKNGPGGTIDAIGYTYYFRRLYKYSPRDLAKYDSPKDVDFCSNLFGYVSKTNARKGRVSVETCAIDDGAEEDGKWMLVLAGPHESCIRNYIKQDPAQITNYAETNYKKLRDYGSCDCKVKSELAGRKYYWHRKADDGYRDIGLHPQSAAKENDNGEAKANENMISSVFPLKAGASAEFSVDLDHLTKAEVGAVIEALRLPFNKGGGDDAVFCHKIGGAKPYGFGSVKITIEHVRLYEPGKRYSSLKDRLENPAGADLGQEAVDEFIKEFEGRISAETGVEFEKLPFWKALLAMTMFEKRQKDGSWKLATPSWRTEFMPLDTGSNPYPHPNRNSVIGFSDKSILPPAEEVKAHDYQKK